VIIAVLTSAIQVCGYLQVLQQILRVGWIRSKVWRVWVIWGATRYANLVTVLPVLCFLTFTG
jgi:hypothetical protein